MPSLKPKLYHTYLGIDPGLNGALVSLYRTTVVTTPMPVTERDIWDWIFAVTATPKNTITTIIENPGTGHPGSGKSQVAKMYGSYTALRMALTAASVRFEAVTGAVWQKALAIPRKKKTETRTQWKNRLKARAQQLFPKVEVTLKTADALLIAEYCRRKHKGLLE